MIEAIEKVSVKKEKNFFLTVEASPSSTWLLILVLCPLGGSYPARVLSVRIG